MHATLRAVQHGKTYSATTKAKIGAGRAGPVVYRDGRPESRALHGAIGQDRILGDAEKDVAGPRRQGA